MSKLFQIKEDDLAALERSLPLLVDALLLGIQDRNSNRFRVCARQCQQILSDVRWNYGPPSEVETIPVEDKG